MARIKQLRFLKKNTYFKTTQEDLTSLLSNRYLKREVQLIFFLLAFSFLFLAWSWSKIPPQVPLFYSLPRGEEQLASKIFLIFLPLSCLVFILVNLKLASVFFKKEFFLSQILTGISLVITLLTATALIKIIIITT